MVGKKAAESELWVQLIDASGWIHNLALEESAAVTGVRLVFKCALWDGARGR